MKEAIEEAARVAVAKGKAVAVKTDAWTDNKRKSRSCVIA